MSPLTVTVPDDLLEQVAHRAAELVLEQLSQLSTSSSPYMTIPEAAEYARCKRQRIDDLLSSGRLTRYKDGSRTLVGRAELDAYLTAGSLRVGPFGRVPHPTQLRVASGE